MTARMASISELIEARKFVELEADLAKLSSAEAARAIAALAPLEKLIAFKLLDASRALEVFDALPFEDRYLVLCGFPLQSIAPVLEDLTYAQRRPFVQLPRDFYERMFRKLAEAR